MTTTVEYFENEDTSIIRRETIQTWYGTFVTDTGDVDQGATPSTESAYDAWVASQQA